VAGAGWAAASDLVDEASPLEHIEVGPLLFHVVALDLGLGREMVLVGVGVAAKVDVVLRWDVAAMAEDEGKSGEREWAVAEAAEGVVEGVVEQIVLAEYLELGNLALEALK